MPGVEILSSAEVVTQSAFNWLLFWVVEAVCIIPSLIIAIWCYHDTDKVGVLLSFPLIGILLGTFIGGAAGSKCSNPTAYETEYKVTISDEVSLNEFYERYEVIDQEGKIFTVRERVES